MSPADERPMDLEDQTRTLLAESVTRIDSRIRSRLNQARQVAVAEVAVSRRPGLLRGYLVPTAGVAAAVLVTMMLWQQRPAGVLPMTEGGQMAVEDLDLIADGEGLDMVEDSDGSFYEWAADQGDTNGETSS